MSTVNENLDSALDNIKDANERVADAAQALVMDDTIVVLELKHALSALMEAYMVIRQVRDRR